MAHDEVTNPMGTGEVEDGLPPARGRHEELIGRLDAARAALEEAAEVCDAFGEEDAWADAWMAFHIAGEVAGVIEEHERIAGTRRG